MEECMVQQQVNFHFHSYSSLQNILIIRIKKKSYNLGEVWVRCSSDRPGPKLLVLTVRL